MIKIEVQAHQGVNQLYPVFVCDYCKKRIEDADLGLYHYRQNEQGRPLGKNVAIYHKVPCSHMAEAKEQEETGDISWPWLELRDLVGQLINNSGLKWSILVNEYCPMEDLKAVQKVTKRKMGED